MKTETLHIQGMSCGHCVHAVQQALAAVPNVAVQSVDIGTATVAYDPFATQQSAIIEAVEEEGYIVIATE